MIRVAILGASGYGGAELIRRLSRHPEVEVAALASRQYAGRPLYECWPQLAGLTEARFVLPEEALAAGDVIFTATPHGETAGLVAQARAAGRKVIDLSADFRLPVDLYEEWYGLAHPHPELYGEGRDGLVDVDSGGGGGEAAHGSLGRLPAARRPLRGVVRTGAPAPGAVRGGTLRPRRAAQGRARWGTAGGEPRLQRLGGRPGAGAAGQCGTAGRAGQRAHHDRSLRCRPRHKR